MIRPPRNLPDLTPLEYPPSLAHLAEEKQSAAPAPATSSTDSHPSPRTGQSIPGNNTQGNQVQPQTQFAPTTAPAMRPQTLPQRSTIPPAPAVQAQRTGEVGNEGRNDLGAALQQTVLTAQSHGVKRTADDAGHMLPPGKIQRNDATHSQGANPALSQASLPTTQTQQPNPANPVAQPVGTSALSTANVIGTSQPQAAMDISGLAKQQQFPQPAPSQQSAHLNKGIIGMNPAFTGMGMSTLQPTLAGFGKQGTGLGAGTTGGANLAGAASTLAARAAAAGLRTDAGQFGYNFYGMNNAWNMGGTSLPMTAGNSAPAVSAAQPSVLNSQYLNAGQDALLSVSAGDAVKRDTSPRPTSAPGVGQQVPQVNANGQDVTAPPAQGRMAGARTGANGAMMSESTITSNPGGAGGTAGSQQP
ncbi:hypothetical protein HK097_000298 [Rhizophlyctis rosea]|uniref:Uncharacterized protein n=1 Tax=Rhizophlyctis rosea TaxID=64517 RepID=A0AAD5SGJ0_9FUNG|nr:hypothetical protein HK097_000298 [Rhizophlyctis rosea]